MEIIGYIVYALLGGIISVILSANLHEKNLSADDAMNEVDQNDNVIFLCAECLENTIYLFDSETDKFVCQGKDYEELMNNFKYFFPNKVGAIISYKTDSQEMLDKFLDDVGKSNGVS